MPRPDPAHAALTPELIAGHERLHPRVVALLKHVEKSALRQPQQAVPAALLGVARQLFREARKILGREAGRTGPAATADLGALAVGLGQLRAALEAFEAANSGWSKRLRCTVWRLQDPPRPVLRLLPPGIEAVEVEPPKPTGRDGPREQLMRLIMGRYAAGYDQGYRHAKEGLPPSSEWAEGAWDQYVKEWGGDEEKARQADLKRRYGTTRPPPHLMPVGAEPGEWARLEEEREAARKAARAEAGRIRNG